MYFPSHSFHSEGVTDVQEKDMFQRKPKHFINSLARGLKILAAFSADNPRLTLQELADLSGFNKTAVQRLTDTLMALGYLGRNRRKEFYLEPRILTLGFNYLNGPSSVLRAAPKKCLAG